MTDLEKIQFGHLVKILLLLLEAEKANREITISQISPKTGISPSVFYGSLKTKLERAGLVKYRHNPDRTITVHLTEKGRKLAECLERCREALSL